MSEEVYSHGHHDSVVQTHARRTAENSAAYLLPHLRPGSEVLDVGAGPGTITADLAELVAPGRVVGIDRSAEVIVQASELATERGLGNLSFDTGDVYNLPYDDGSFDLAHAHQVLHHLSQPVDALREMRRVVRDGGMVAVRDADYHAMSWYPELPALAEWMELYQRIARGNGAEPDAGRRLLSWAQQAGFSAIEPSVSTWVYATEAERGWFADSWATRVLHSSFAAQALERKLASQADLERISAGFDTWGKDPGGWFVMLHAEIIATV